MSSIIAFLSPINLTRHVAIARPPTCGATPSLVQKGPQTPTPSYTSIDARPQNKLFTAMFLSKLQLELGQKASSAGYAGVIEVVLALAGRHRANPTELRLASQRVLRSLFPTWLPPAFAALFSRPFPRFAAWINAVVTVAVTQWLMGASQLADDGTTVEIERCRYLEETGCVGICVNSCKAATEAFFQHDMGLQLSIEPDLEDFSCKFHFGKTALSLEEDAMYQQQCLSACPLAFPASHKPCHAVTDAMRHAPMEGNAD